MVEKVYVTYNEVHNLCKNSAPRILNDFAPNLMIAIGGGGYVPARILRSFLKKPGSPNIPIQAIGLSLYESLPTGSHDSSHLQTNDAPTDGTTPASNDPAKSVSAEEKEQKEDPVEIPSTKVTRTQWLDFSSLSMSSLIGKSILIVDEVDDTRTTLEYAVKELEKDVEAMRQKILVSNPIAQGPGSSSLSHPEREALAEMASKPTRFSIFVLHNKGKEKRGVLPREMFEEGRYLAARETGDVWICYPWEAGDIEEHDRLAREQGERGVA